MSEPRDTSPLDSIGKDAARAARSLPVSGEPLSGMQILDIRERLAAHLKDFHVPQTQVAKALGVSESYISALLADPDSLPAATMQRLARRANAWMDDDYSRRVNARPTNFVETTVATIILTTARVRELAARGHGFRRRGRMHAWRWSGGAVGVRGRMVMVRRGPHVWICHVDGRATR